MTYIYFTPYENLPVYFSHFQDILKDTEQAYSSISHYNGRNVCYGKDSIVSLIARNSQLYHMPDLYPLSNLSIINISNNMLTSLPIMPLSITSIDCSTNSIRVIYELTLYTNLTDLDCSDNLLETLPLLPFNMKKLSCTGNNILEYKNIEYLEEFYYDEIIEGMDDIYDFHTQTIETDQPHSQSQPRSQSHFQPITHTDILEDCFNNLNMEDN